jgi:hypothetical protein
MGGWLWRERFDNYCLCGHPEYWTCPGWTHGGDIAGWTITLEPDSTASIAGDPPPKARHELAGHLPADDPATVSENMKRTLIAELRPCIRSILFAADQPMATTAVTAAAHERGCRVSGPPHLPGPGHARTRRRTRRAGRAGTAVRSEMLWQVALTAGDLNPEFARLVGESGDADRAAARDAQTSPAVAWPRTWPA